MVFRLVSDGRTTHAEIDGKDIGGDIKAIYYSHDMDCHGLEQPVLSIRLENGTLYDSRDDDLPEMTSGIFSFDKVEKLLVEAGKNGDVPDYWHRTDK